MQNGRTEVMRRWAKLQPWYHVVSPQCQAVTVAQEQCVFTARYTDAEGKGIYLCKTHADMADFPTKPLRAVQRTIRD